MRIQPVDFEIRSIKFLLFFWLLAVVLLGQARAQSLPGLTDAEQAEVSDPLSAAAISDRLAQVDAEIVEVEQQLAGSDQNISSHWLEVRSQLQKLHELLTLQKSLIEEPVADLELQAKKLADTPPSEISVLALNELYENQMLSGTDTERLDTSRELLTQAKEEFETAEKERRKSRSKLKQLPDGPKKERASQALKQRQLASRVAEETVHLYSLETQLLRSRLELAPQIDINSLRIEQMRKLIREGKGDIGTALAALVSREGELHRLREAAERRLSTAELRLQASQARYKRLTKPSQALLEEVDLLTTTRDLVRREIALLDSQLERLGQQRETWRQWLSVIKGAGTEEELQNWATAANEQIQNLQQLELQRQGRIEDFQHRLTTIEGRIASQPDDSAQLTLLRRQAQLLADLLTAFHAEIISINQERRLIQRLLADIDLRGSRFDPMRYVAISLSAVSSALDYEIAEVDDEPITLGSLILALALFAMSLWASRRGSAMVGNMASNRFKLDAGAAQTLQSLSFYALLVGFMLLALRSVHFPLTAFTVLGGAIAIGVGFGSQNVMNNFISGLILMLERPVRVRDVIEVDNNHGIIEKIGARSTQIRSTDGRHIVVPNSFFLESNVVNWTLSDELIRTKVSVGVNYGSPTRLVEQLILQVVRENVNVLNDPEPIIVFQDFAESSLNFDAHFWVTARSPMQVQIVQSQIRFQIDDLFREHDLVIAFPQLDVHLDTSRPFEIAKANSGKGDYSADNKE